jgi:hypothetical protein
MKTLKRLTRFFDMALGLTQHCHLNKQYAMVQTTMVPYHGLHSADWMEWVVTQISTLCLFILLIHLKIKIVHEVIKLPLFI